MLIRDVRSIRTGSLGVILVERSVKDQDKLGKGSQSSLIAK